MYQINENYQKLPGSYLFSTIAKKVKAFFTKTFTFQVNLSGCKYYFTGNW